MADNTPIPETGFIQAAGLAIKSLQDTAAAQQEALKTAQKDANWRKIQVRILGFVSVVLVLVCVLGTVQYFHTRDIAAHVQQGSITQCENGNSIRRAEAQVWNDFIAIAVKGNKDPRAHAFAVQFGAEIARVYVPRDCTKIFGTKASSANAG